MKRPLRFPRVSTIRAGVRDPVGRVAAVVRRVTAPGAVLHVVVAHDGGCPCESGTAPLTKCTCDVVDLTLRPDVPAGDAQS